MEDLNAALMQDTEVKQKIRQEIYWENVMNPASQSVLYQEYRIYQKNQLPNEVPSEKPTLLEVMERFRGKNLFPEGTERTKTYLERMGFNDMPHPNPMQAVAITQEETEREALMKVLEGQIRDIKEKGV
jgi:type IV secretory pathway VirB4 component